MFYWFRFLLRTLFHHLDLFDTVSFYLTALLKFRNYDIIFSCFRSQILSGALIRLEYPKLRSFEVCLGFLLLHVFFALDGTPSDFNFTSLQLLLFCVALIFVL